MTATLVLSGENDVRTTVADTERLYAALPNPKSMEIIGNAAHEGLERFDSTFYWETVRRFLRNTCSKTATNLIRVL